MKIQVEEISSVKKSIRVEVPQDAVSHELHHTLEHLQKDVRLPGFRPGKVPRAILMKKYDEALQEEILQKLIPEYCHKAIAEAKLSPIDVPAIADIDFKKDAPLFFTAIIDILPEIKLTNYTGLTLSKIDISITPEDVEKELAVLQNQQGYLDALPDDHEIAASDYVIIDYIGEVAGKTISGGKKKDFPVEIGANQIRPEIEAALMGKKSGDVVLVDVTMPVDDPEKEIAGKTAQFKIDVKEIKVKRLPDLDEEFAKDLGLASLSELREKVEGSMVSERTKIQEQYQKNQLVNKLIEAHPIEVPLPMVERELRFLLQQRKMTPESEPALVQDLSAVAEHRVKGSLILAAITKKERIAVSDAEMEEAIRQTTKNVGVPFEKGKREILKNPDAERGLRGKTLESKTIDWVYATAQFEQITVGTPTTVGTSSTTEGGRSC